jgi:transposase
LPRRRQEIDVPEAQKQCPCCGGQRVRIGEEIKEQLDYEPASGFVQQTVRPKYACPKCTAAGVAPLPPQPIDKGLPGLLAYVLTSKWADHLPLYRLEHILARQGVAVARSTLGDWAAAAELLRPMYELMHLSVVGSSIMHSDATPVRVRDEKYPGKTRLGCFWLTIGDTVHPYRVFHYSETQGQERPKKILERFAGFLHADGASALDPVYRALPRITEVGCWAHARRGFFEAKESHPEAAHQALAYIRRLYAIELFLGSAAGGKTAEVHLSLIATCKGLGIEPFAYLRDLLSRLPTHPPDRLAELLPDHWAQAKRRQLLAEELAKPPPAAAAVPERAQPPPDVPSG